MPRPGPRKQSVTVRLSFEAINHLDGMAEEAGLTRIFAEPNRSAAVERLIAVAWGDPSVRARMREDSAR